MGKYYFIKDTCLYFFKIMLCFIVLSLVIIFAVWAGNKLDDKRSKNECYEIYATDNVILKKCEKYFDKGSEMDE